MRTWLFVVGILGVNQEPTNHALRDIAALKDDLERWGRKLVLLFPDEARCKKFRPEEFPGLPSTVIYGVDTDGISARIAEDMKFRHKGNTAGFYHCRYIQPGSLCVARLYNRSGRATDEDGERAVIGEMRYQVAMLITKVWRRLWLSLFLWLSRSVQIH